MKSIYVAPFFVGTEITPNGVTSGGTDIPWYIKEAKQGQSYNNQTCWSDIRIDYVLDGNDVIFCNPK